MEIELLAPGGSYNSVLAAFNAGADAVYTGGNMFGARAGAENLTLEQLIDVIQYAHIHRKKIYLTVNTLLKDEEIENELYNFLLPLYENGLDAVIVQDMGVLLFVRRYFPELRIHASTQMTILGAETIKELENLGVCRVVMPRELSLEEIRDIHRHTSLEIESFVHGALCYCYSGQCFLSSYIGGRSGNRGRCAQPCRMEYDMIAEGRILNPGNQKYILSPKDICTLNIVPDIMNAGVCSLKIEGRMKKMEYVAGVVSIYRKYIDLYRNHPDQYKVDEEDLKRLADLFHRNGFHESYYYQHNGADMISLKRPQFRKENRELNQMLRENYSGKILKRKIDVKVKCVKNHPLEIITVIDGETIMVSGMVPEQAKNRPTEKETVIRQICKSGNTDFSIQNIDVEMGEELFLPIGALNELRRRFLSCVEQFILSKNFRTVQQPPPMEEYIPFSEQKFAVTVSVWNKEQLNAVLSLPVAETVYLEIQGFGEALSEAMRKAKEAGKRVMLALPYIFRKADKELLDKRYFTWIQYADGILVRNVEEYFYLLHRGVDKNFVFDYNVYTNNRISKQYYLRRGKTQTTVPLELNYQELKKRGVCGEEFIVYGYMPVMISAGCGFKTCGACFQDNRQYQLGDRLGNRFPAKCVCESCYNIIYNCKPLSLFSYAGEILELNPKSVRICFTLENERQARDVLRKAQEAFLKKNKVQEDDKTTRGHFKRGVL